MAVLVSGSGGGNKPIGNAVRQTLKCVDLAGIPNNCFVNVLQGAPIEIDEIQKVINTEFGGVNNLQWIDAERFVFAYALGGTTQYVRIGRITDGKTITLGASIGLWYDSTSIYDAVGVLPDPYDDTNVLVALGSSEDYGIGLWMLSVNWDTLTINDGATGFIDWDLRVGTEMYGNGYGGISGGFDSESVIWLSSNNGFFVVKFNRTSRTLSLLGEKSWANGSGSHAVRISQGVCMRVDCDNTEKYAGSLVKFTTTGTITEGALYTFPEEGHAGYRSTYPKTLFCTDLGTVLWLSERYLYKVSYNTSQNTITGATVILNITAGWTNYGGWGRLASGEYWMAVQISTDIMQLYLMTETSSGAFDYKVTNLNLAEFIGRYANLELNENGYGLMYPSNHYSGYNDQTDAMIYGLFTTFDGVIKAVSDNYWFGVSRSSAEYGENIKVEVLA